MDTNMSKALMMAGGVLMALIVISALTYFFRELTPFQQQLEDIEAMEQTSEFNKQYEVYNKSLMLGVDIISVINKAYSNNRAYIEAYGYSQDIKENYLIDIQLLGKDGNNIKLNQTLDIRLTKWDGTKVREVSIDVNDLQKSKSIEDLTALLGTSPQDTWDEKEIVSPTSLIDENRHTGVPEEELYVNKDIYYLIIKNTKLKDIFNNTTGSTKDDWTKATFETYAYDLKTKKFKCTEVQNSEITGRIIKMTFEEI